MPKLKTCRGAAKRFKVNAKGQIKHRSQNRNHILTKKATKRLRHLRATSWINSADTKAVLKMLRKK